MYFGGHAQFAPLVLRYGRLLPIGSTLTFERQILALAVLNFVEYDIVFERVRADDVVVVLVAVAPHDARRLILLPRNGFELHADVSVFRRDAVVNAEREAVARR